MNKRLKYLNINLQLADFIEKISAKWQLGTQPNTPMLPKAGESTEDILRDLIAMPTTPDNREANNAALDYIENFLSSRGLQVKRLEWNGVGSLVATTCQTKTPKVFLAGHIDVVPAPASQFELKATEDKYFGRGVMDMKGAVAAYLGAVQVLHSKNKIHDYDFGIMIMTDEEVGGFDGAAKLVEAGYLPEVIVIPDGGNCNWGVERSAKGVWHVTLESTGKSAHGSRPWEGVSAIDNLMAALDEIRQLFDGQGPRTNTFNIGIISGGKAINQIPAKATASIDMRMVSVDEEKRIRKLFEEVISRYNIKLTTEIQADAMVNDSSHPLLAAYAEATEEVTGKPVEWVDSNAGHDGRFFAKEGVHCAVSFPLGGNHHGQGEWISKDSLLKMQQIYLDYLDKVAKIAARG